MNFNDGVTTSAAVLISEVETYTSTLSNDQNELIKQLVPISDHPVFEALKLIDPSPRLYAQLMVQAYAPGGGTPPPGWIRLTNSDSEGFSNGGYFGVAYINETTKQMLIAHRGTALSDVQDIRSDVTLAFGLVPLQFNDGAEPFLTAAKERYSQFFGQEIAESEILHTGHSLGAVLAEMSAYKFHGKAVTFDSPGSLPIIQNRFDSGVKAGDVNVISFQAAPHAINRVNEHVGHVYRVYPPQKFGVVEFQSVLQQHSKEGILEQFNAITNLPFVVSDQGIGGWNRLSGWDTFIPNPFGPDFFDFPLIEKDFDKAPHFWWAEQLAFLPESARHDYLLLNLGGGVQNPAPSVGVEIVGDNAPNQLWGDTTGNDILIPGGNADEVFSYGGDDNIQLGVNGASDGSGDTIRIVTTPGTIGARQLHYPDTSDFLVWDDLPLQGLAEELSAGGYRLMARVGNDERAFTLRLSGDTLLIEPEDDRQNSITVYGFYEGALGIYLDSRNVESCTETVNIIIGKTDGAPIEGTCGPDEVKADGDSSGDNYDDNIKTYAGDDVIFTNSNLMGIDGSNIVDAGPGNDNVIAGFSADTIYGGLGNDELFGGDGDDIIYGGDGNDHLSTSNVRYGPFFWDSHLFGGPGNDKLGTIANSYLDGGPGDDDLSSGIESILIGGDGNDNLVTYGNSEAYGGPGNDFLSYGGNVDCRCPYEDFPLLGLISGDSGDDSFYITDSERDGSILVIDGGSGKNEYTFKELEYLNGVRFKESNSDGNIYYEKYDEFHIELLKVPLWEQNNRTTTYNDATGGLSVEVIAGTTSVTLSSASIHQSVATFVIENFYNGMLGITGIEGAPSLPATPITPTVSITNSLYLPLIQGMEPQGYSPNGQKIANVETRHPMVVAHPEHTAYVAIPLPYEATVLMTAGVMPVIVYGGRALTGKLPPKVVCSIHHAINSLQTEFDVAHTHAERAIKRTKQWFHDKISSDRNAA